MVAGWPARGWWPRVTAYRITVRQVTSERFAPFGQLLTAEGTRRSIDLYGSTIDVYSSGIIDSDRPVEILVSRSSVREFRLHFLERHFELAQSFIPLGGEPFVVAVARPDARLESGVPAFDEIHAFVVPGYVGVTVHRGTWHEPPFALVDDSVRLTTSHTDLTQGLESKLNEEGEIRQLDVDKRNIEERTGIVVRIDLS